ncbi:SCO6745 family protein [Actinoplanes sp. CA-142083]|uniref:SCO6745 family protein n=1 Tax=Actinoplanes sp. CA-142083 TaxID=3239903 RepID=UPI003D940B1E
MDSEGAVTGGTGGTRSVAAQTVAGVVAGAPIEGRMLYAGLRALAVPEVPVARLWHAATLLREHRGDGHNAALVANGIGGTEAPVLLAISSACKRTNSAGSTTCPRQSWPPSSTAYAAAAWSTRPAGFTDGGHQTKNRSKTLTDELTAPAYDALSPDELDELIAGLEPTAAAAQAADS